jgi:CarD family transcriptional regulator, regulator of rRNA transcription
VTLGGDGASTPHFETAWSRRNKVNRTKLASGDVSKVAEVIRGLSRIDEERGLSAGERRMLAKARQIVDRPPEP